MKNLALHPPDIIEYRNAIIQLGPPQAHKPNVFEVDAKLPAKDFQARNKTTERWIQDTMRHISPPKNGQERT